MKHPYSYKEADKVIVFMENDPDLRPIEYIMPDPGPIENSINYGLEPKDQKWHRFEMPIKLQELQDMAGLSPSEKHKILEDNQAYYDEEIEFIAKDWQRVHSGCSILINGKQYYLTGDNYFWLQHWRIDGKPVEFRYRDYKSWHFDNMVDNDSDILGTNYPKHRREGCTNRRKCKQYRKAITNKHCHCGMQSKDEQHAKAIHETLLMPVWRDYLPFWLKPIWNGQRNDQSSIKFFSPLSQKDPDYGKKSLNSWIDFRDSGEKAYDGLKLRDLFNDEIGKTVEVDVKRRFDIQRQCLMEGSTIIGKIFNGSTVDEMDKGGGRNFKIICDQSHYHKRNKFTNRTASFLVNFFQPASEGFDGEIPAHMRERFAGQTRWIDEYGFDVIDPETGRPAAEIYHLSVRKEYELNGDEAGLIEYTRQFPLRWKDCWRASAKECNFNLVILDNRIDELQDSNPYKQRGNFMWKNNIRDTEVVWCPDENGKFFLSYQFGDPREANAFYMQDGQKIPANTKLFCAGGDPYRFKETKGKRKSNGGGAVFMKHNPRIDPPETELRNYKTNRFCCTYDFRPKDKKIYGEDMIMMCHYFGCTMNTEINVEFLWDYFEDRGYGRYLYYPFDVRKNKLSITPGQQASDKTREEIFREYQYYIQHFGATEVHDELLIQCRDIENDMGDYDLFAAGGYALTSNERSKFEPEKQDVVDVAELFPAFIYN
jgi:hypothetical protein